ncbi:hypothetical protein [Flavonifractor sp. An100]|uniref:hypothetical protein n=1 Tax=Flavonifractor sp. An100 TaxID=1965538 RepID=UPI000B3AC506|nr:hypothetical protein [Flavonifractor sp. An100]OUQ77510.1 hypothetical protein B5E43_10400 [Flavonifractor sp. An100]
MDKRQENIDKLENLAQEVLKLKNLHRQRRPIIIEFCGSPKAGKTSSITALNIFLKRNGFKTTILTERASICPISDKESPVFNVWTCSATINEINEKMDEANTASEGNLDIILCDRGIFDALCWFRWLKSRDKMSEEEYDVLTQFAMLNRWQKNIDLVYIFLTTPEESIRREYANLLTNKRGSIMKEDILEQYKKSVEETLHEYESAFRATCVQDTTDREQNDVSYEVTEKTLQTLKEMLMEKIGYADRSSLFLQEGLIDYSKVKCELEKVKYGLREEVEANSDFIQPIAIAAIISEDGGRILCVKKTRKSTDASSPEFGQTLLYVGGHMRREDSTAKCRSFLDVLRNTLERELYEELGISFALNQKRDPFVIYTPNSNKSRKHLAIGWVIKLNEGSKLRLDSYELVQKKGRSKSGTFIPFQNITDPDISLESWSKTILLNIFADKLSESQKALLSSSTSEQLSILES